jgi:hypothetical protein
MRLDDEATARAWFTEVIEPLADSFEAANVTRYVQLFSEVLEQVDPRLRQQDVVDRYQRIRQPRVFTGPDPEDVFVLSRVTLGADVAITSVALDAAKQRFPDSRIWFVGSEKGFELFASDWAYQHAAVPYNRTGSVRDRVAASQALREMLDRPNAIVIDPDSRLTQLGLVQVCPESQYFFWESRGSDEPGTLSQMAARWLGQTFGVADTKAFIAPPPIEVRNVPDITVSLGVGENARKRVADPFERMLMEALTAIGTVLVDEGAGGEEADRVAAATAGLPNVQRFQGSFAGFAARIAVSRSYVGYDSAGQHAASASGVPLATAFAGYPNERFVERWQPSGPGRIAIFRAPEYEPESLVEQIIASIA